ncbi:hypothetical protein GGF46_002536 [Coemansia sp. RSA 552]|nr:hypothetical protein GGF46_002536 [Coemansia sp. RSA 552]
MTQGVAKRADNTGSRRRKKKSRKEKLEAEEAQRQQLLKQLDSHTEKQQQQLPEGVAIEYVAQQDPDVENTEFADYSAVFAQFANNAAKSFGVDADEAEEEEEVPSTVPVSDGKANGAAELESDEEMRGSSGSDSSGSGSDDDEGNAKSGLSRKQKKRSRMSVAELKQMAPRPEVVEWTDTSARDPGLLVELKAIANTVPVPVHWSQKKKYLQYKRGMEKPPFELPDFIKATGIMEMRDSIRDREDEKTSKSIARERMRPKMNKLTLDYQRLHDAFFRFQTPPKNLTGHGDLFYEGKESDVEYDFTPGVLSESLKEALNIPPLAPPPWLINMQRFGPPPSYPDLVIPGLNAPIPAGAQWGYHPGGWGRPPVDELGRPLYGDVFAAGPDAAQMQRAISAAHSGPKKHWGDLEILESSDEEESESEEESEEEEEDENAEESGAVEAEPQGPAELTDEQLRSGLASIPSGLETPSVIQLRKQPVASAAGGDKSLYTVLPERESARLEGIMGSQFTYDMGKALDPSKKPAGGRRGKSAAGGVEIALDASELENMDQEALQAKYEAASAAKTAEAGGGGQQEDLSDMVAEHAAALARKRKAAASSAPPKKKTKDYNP